MIAHSRRFVSSFENEVIDPPRDLNDEDEGDEDAAGSAGGADAPHVTVAGG